MNTLKINKIDHYDLMEEYDSVRGKRSKRKGKKKRKGLGVRKAVKQAKARRSVKRTARKSARSAGLSKRAARTAGRAAKAKLRGTQERTLIGKIGRVAAGPAALIAGGTKKSRKRRSAKLQRKAELQAKGVKGKKLRQGARMAKQEVRARQLEKKGRGKKAARVRARKGKTGIAVGAKKVGKAAAKLALAPLIPFKAAMAKILNKQGVKASRKDKVGNLVEKFYKNILKKDTYDPAYINDVDLDLESDNVVGTVITVVADAVLNFFTQSKNKKDSGQDMTKSEKVAAGALEKVEEKVETQAKETAAEELGERLLFDPKVQMIIAAVLIGVIALFFFAGKGGGR